MRQIVPRKGRRDRRTPSRAVPDYAARGWPVLPAVTAAPDGSCRCGAAGCPAPGAHPGGPALPELPELLAATSEPRMVRRWWALRPYAPILLATGGTAPCAVSLPAPTGRRVVAALDLLGTGTGPVLATPERWALLVAPYETGRLGEALCALLDGPEAGRAWDGTPTGRLPDGLRFHGAGGYLPLPPSVTGRGRATWLRPPPPPPAAPSVGDGGRSRSGEAACGPVGGPSGAALPEPVALLRALLDAERLGLLAAPATARRRSGRFRPHHGRDPRG